MLHFSKSLAKYYHKWYEDSLESADFCRHKGEFKRAEDYERDAEQFKKVIDENTEAIEFFSQGDNANLIDRALPEKWRGYK